MSTGYTGEDPSQAATEEELRAAYEAEIKKIRIEQVLLEQVVTLINLGMRRTGLSPGTEDERDLDQVRLAIDSIRALMPLIDQNAAPQAAPIREALSQLQLAFVKLGGAAGPGDSLSGQAPGATGPARHSAGAERPRAATGGRSGARQARRTGPSAAQRAALGSRPVAPLKGSGCRGIGPLRRRSGLRHARLAPGFCRAFAH